MIGGVIFMFLFGVGIAGTFIWFYRKEDTRKTMEHFDERTRWTDGVPAPVLAISITAIVLIALSLVASIQQTVLSSGSMRVRAWAILLPLALAALLLITAVQCYRMRASGWLLAVANVVLGGVAWCLIVWTNDPQTQLEAMGIGGLHIEAGFYDDLVASQKLGQIISTAVLSVAAMAYLMWCRKFFTRTAVTRA
jgi:hypothetical protein